MREIEGIPKSTYYQLRVLNLAISNKSSLACTNFSVFKREQIYVHSNRIHFSTKINSVLYF